MIEQNIAGDAIQRYFDDVLEIKKMNRAAIAKKAHLSAATLSRLVHGQRAARRSTLLALERATGVPLPLELRLDAEDTLTEAPPRGLDTTPIFAMLANSISGRYWRNEAAADVVQRPPGILNNKRAYAIRMPDNSMAPWRRANELIFIDPTLRAVEGDHVLLETNHPSDPNHSRPLFLVARLVSELRSGLRIRRYKDDEEETIPQRDVVEAFRVLEWHEVAGIR